MRVTRPEADFEEERRHAASAATITVSANDQAELAARVAAQLKADADASQPAADADAMPPSKDRRLGLWLGIGAMVVIAAGAIAAIFLLR